MTGDPGTEADTRPTLAVWKFASCDGCQLTLLDCEDELLALTDRVRIRHFLETTCGRRQRAGSGAEAGPAPISRYGGNA